jgi:hypothetical protein
MARRVDASPCVQMGKGMEARAGIEPTYEDLQTDTLMSADVRPSPETSLFSQKYSGVPRFTVRACPLEFADNRM